MTRQTLAEALQPLAAKMPKAVREHEILRIGARLTGSDSAAANQARREILIWAQNRSGGRLPGSAWAFKDFECFSGGRNSVGVRIETDQSDIWAIRADDPDKNIPGRIWTTEVVVGVMKDQLPRFSARLLVSTTEDQLKIEPHAPGFVQQVAERCGLARGPYEINAEPRIISSKEEAEHLVEMLVDPARQLPVFVLTAPDDAADPSIPLLDGRALGRALLGLGHVSILPAQFTWALTESFGKRLSVFGGAVRAYLPGFQPGANPYAHRLVLRDQLLSRDGTAQCARWMRSLAAAESIRRTALGRDVLSFAAIRNAALQTAQQALENTGASDSDQLEAAKARIHALERQVSDQAASLEYFDTEHKRAEERAEAAEEQARASAFRIQHLLEQLKARGESADAGIELPATWEEFAGWCDVHLAGRVVLTPLARRNVRAPVFSDIQLAARCLLWLANQCRDRRLQGGNGSLREEPLEDGVRNAHCGGDQFDLDWQGQRYTADWHIKNGGNTRDPRRCLRIYYFWEPANQEIVIADMPAHRRTDAS